MDMDKMCDDCKEMDLMQLVFKEIDDEQLTKMGYENHSGHKFFSVYNSENELIANIYWSTIKHMWSCGMASSTLTAVEIRQLNDFVAIMTEQSKDEMN